jgi:hypothetical protein
MKCSEKMEEWRWKNMDNRKAFSIECGDGSLMITLHYEDEN